ncbi:MAG: PQQ-dependent sugar dehydrogenase, partial [Myxococcales bacterium]|nr:PQQ-dependent sugar dehydrogenase [Myxococcales bacterium]
PEIFAWGLRNPWRFSFDRVTGDLWVGDVGQSAWEEIDLVTRGRNYGWRRMEGFHCYNPSEGCDTSPPLARPVLEYGRAVGYSVTGGFVYRGAEMPSWYGAYLFADYGFGTVFAFRAGEAPSANPVATAPGNVPCFGEDDAGELYVATGGSSGRLYRLVETAPEPLPAAFPTTLSATGCFSDLATLTPAPGVLPYAVNAPFYSSGADKARFLSLPEGGHIGFSGTAPWTFPAGTVLVKHFTLGEGEGARPVETRLLVVGEGAVRGYSYRWDEDGADATLLEGAAVEDVAWHDASGAAHTTAWPYPSRPQCRACHTEAAGGALGVSARQLDRPAPDAPGQNQLARLAALGLFDPPPPDEPTWRALPSPSDAAEPVAERARAWLDANCSGCHRPGGPTGTDLDLRALTELDHTGACDAPPVKDDLGLADARVIAPGEPARSVLLARLTRLDGLRMPPLGSDGFDVAGAALVEAWISGLTSCDDDEEHGDD